MDTSKNGKYSIKEGYKLLQRLSSNKTPSQTYIFYWNDVVLPKVGYFAWLPIRV